jgi:alpha-galactosidase
MGYNNWARHECALNETLFTTTADAMVSRGLLTAGYNRLNLDDCWMQRSRASDGYLQWNTTLFPKGLPWLANYVKSKGFHLGIYQDSGNETCGGYPGSRGYEAQDAQSFSSWGIDYLKLDGCNMFAAEGRTLQEEFKYRYGRWHDVLVNMKNPLIFSQSAPAYFCGSPDFTPQANKSDWHRVMAWVPLYGELARHSDDIAVYGLYQTQEYWESIMTNYAYEVLLARYQRPGFYNDPDFLTPDWPWLTLDEKKSHFALWASFSAPLIISANVPDLSADEVAYLTNKDVIAVDQDALALQATLVSQDGTWDVLTKSLSNGDRLLTVLNRSGNAASTIIGVERIGLMKCGSFKAKDLWTGATTTVSDSIKITLPSHATAIYRFSGVADFIPTGMLFNTASMKCLTASGTELNFSNCTSLDSQVWQVSPTGLISPLSASNMCISGLVDKVTLQKCDSNDQTQKWSYLVSGNIRNAASKQCLTERSPRALSTACGDELDAQVFGLPSGVQIAR